jgi:hypothetical protein
LLIACIWLLPLLWGDQLGQSYDLVRDPPFAAGAPRETLPQRALFPDAARAFHPWQVVAREQVRHGQLPLWNPYEYGGQPLLGNMQSALVFPLTWLALLFSPDSAAGAIAVAKLVLAGLGAFGLAREAGVRHWGGALLAGIVYMLSAPLVVSLQWSIGTVYALYPWVLLATLRLAARPGQAPVAGVALAVTLTIAAGHPETALASVSSAGVLLIVLLVARARHDVGEAARIGALWLGAGALGVAGAAVVVFPFLDALGESITERAHTLFVGEVPLYAALQFVAPHLFGNGQPGLYGFAFYSGVAGYFGLPALMLALVALWRWRRQPVAVGLAATALVALMATFGIPPVSWWVSEVRPWSDTFVAGRVYFVVALAGAVGAGGGYSLLTDRPLSLRRVLLISTAVASGIGAGVALAEARGLLEAPESVKWAALALTTVALLAGAGLLAGVGRVAQPVALTAVVAIAGLSTAELRGLNVTLPPDQAYPATPASIDYLQAQPWPFRVQVLRGRDTMVPPNVLAEYGLESLEGYDFPLSKRWSDLEGPGLQYAGLLPERRAMIGPPSPTALRTMRLFNVRYYLGDPHIGPFAGLRVAYRGPDALVLRDPRALPRAFVVRETLPLSDEQALARLAAPDFDPRRVALVPVDAPRLAGGSPDFVAARVHRLSPDHLRVDLPPGPGGWLVVGNAYSSAWKAEVDGARVRLRPTDYAATGLSLPAGARTVDLSLDRTLPLIGALVSLLALLSMALLGWRGRAAARGAADRPPRRPAPPATTRPSAGSGSGRRRAGRSP